MGFDNLNEQTQNEIDNNLDEANNSHQTLLNSSGHHGNKPIRPLVMSANDLYSNLYDGGNIRNELNPGAQSSMSNYLPATGQTSQIYPHSSLSHPTPRQSTVSSSQEHCNANAEDRQRSSSALPYTDTQLARLSYEVKKLM